MLEGWEKVDDKLIKRVPIDPNLKRKRLNDALKSSESRNLVRLISRLQSLLALLHGCLGPGVVVRLSDVVNDVFKRSNDYFACWITEDGNGVKRSEYVFLKEFLVGILYGNLSLHALKWLFVNGEGVVFFVGIRSEYVV